MESVQPQQLPGADAQPPVNVKVHRDAGKVVIEFDRELRWIAMAPSEAKRFIDAVKLQCMIVGG